MLEENTILEFDFATAKSKPHAWLKSTFKLVSLLLIVFVTGYQNPKTAESESHRVYKIIDFQYNLQRSAYSLTEYSSDADFLDIRIRLIEMVKVFFERRDFMPAWTTDYEANQQLHTLIDLLDSARYYGFPKDYFDTSIIKSLMDEFNESKSLKSRIDLELTATHSAIKFMVYINSGIVERAVSIEHANYLETFPDILHFALINNSLKGDIFALQPDMVYYQRIIRSLPNFVDLFSSVERSNPDSIDGHTLFKALYYAGIAETADFYSDESNAEAVYRLQRKYNLPYASGFNLPTHEVLVSLLEYRYHQTCLNINRLRSIRWNEENYLFVNIPEFRLYVIESKHEKVFFNVIVGKDETPTPVFSSRIERIITNPNWTVPKIIVYNEMLDKILKDSTYLSRRGYTVINNWGETVEMSTINWNVDDPLGKNYCIRQKSSAYNALGLVKIDFPNHYNIYIHDTPSKSLFSKKNRAFSYGCIRLENPDKLAQYLTDKYLSDTTLDIKSLISTRKTNEIYLDEQVPIHIQYITCSGTEHNELEFFSDIYNLDMQEIKGLFFNQGKAFSITIAGI